MEKLQELQEFKLRESTNKKGERIIQQTDSRKYKDLLHETMASILEDALDVDITPVDNALIVEIPHNELGAVIIETKFVIKPLDYDVISAGEMYQEKKEKKEKPKDTV